MKLRVNILNGCWKKYTSKKKCTYKCTFRGIFEILTNKEKVKLHGDEVFLVSETDKI